MTDREQEIERLRDLAKRGLLSMSQVDTLFGFIDELTRERDFARDIVETTALPLAVQFGAAASERFLRKNIEAWRAEEKAVEPPGPVCGCATIMRADPSRHFKECPLRGQYPLAMSGPEAFARGWEESCRAVLDLCGGDESLDWLADTIAKLRPPEAPVAESTGQDVIRSEDGR